MAATIESTFTGTLSLEEYIDFCDAHPRLTDPDEAMATADQLRGLANNRGFLARWLNEELKDVYSFQEKNDFKPPTFVLHRGRDYTVRAVVWLPLEGLSDPSMFSYFEPHDHNFDFLTCGYSGPGYRTVIFQYEHDRVAGYPGEQVDFTFGEDTTLPVGKLMYYFSSRDVHIQYPPEALSISLNLILPRKGKAKRQYEFDLERRTVLSQINELPQRRAIFAAAGLAGDGESTELLLSIARRHSCERTRALSWQTLISSHREQAASFLDMAMNDPNVYVKAIATRAFAGLRS